MDRQRLGQHAAVDFKAGHARQRIDRAILRAELLAGRRA